MNNNLISVNNPDFRKIGKTPKIGGINTVKRKELIFYTIGIVIPFIQFIIFYIFVNINSVKMAFSEYNYIGENAGKYTWVGLKNFIWFIDEIRLEPYFIDSLLNGFICYGVGLGCTLLTLLMAFFIYKKMPGGKFFTVMMLLPQMVSGVVVCMVFKYFMEDCVSAIGEAITGTFQFGVFSGGNTGTIFAVLLFFTSWFGFGGSVITYSSVMKGVNQSVIEAAEIDGANSWQEFIHVVIPMIWPTFATFFYCGVAGILTAQCSQYTFFGSNADKKLYTFGYWLFLRTAEGNLSTYPQVAAVGLVLSAICIPLTFWVRHLLFKYGPSEN